MLSTIAKPFAWLLMWLYELVQNYGIAIIIFGLLVKVILLPFMVKSKRSMMRTTLIQPALKELEKKHGANKQKYNEEVQKLYKEEKINPMSGCIWSLIPFPIVLALYQAIRMPLTVMMGIAKDAIEEGGAIFNVLQQLGWESTLNASYKEIDMMQFITAHFDKFKDLGYNLKQIDYTFLGLDLGALPKWQLWDIDWTNKAAVYQGIGLFLIPIIAAVSTYISSKIAAKGNQQQTDGDEKAQQAAKSAGMMSYIMPFITLWFAFLMPAALGLYWIVSTVFSIVQDLILNRMMAKELAALTAERDARINAKNAELEAKRAETARLKAENAMEQNANTSKKKQQIQARKEQERKAAEWEKKNNPTRDSEAEPGQVGTRRYARGRAYDPERYGEKADVTEKTEE